MSAASPTILVADDEPALAEYLRGRLAALWPEATILAPARNGIEALAAIREDEPDAAFLDIRMPGLTGLELASRIEGATHVVFVTAYDQYAVEAFDRNAVDYLVKPVADDRLARAIATAQGEDRRPRGAPGAGRGAGAHRRLAPGRRRGRDPLGARPEGRGSAPDRVDDVLYFQAQDKYTCVITREGEYLIRTALSELSKQLDASLFAQVHRSTVVNMNVVASTRRDLGGRLFVRLKDGKRTELPVSRAYAHLFRQM